MLRIIILDDIECVVYYFDVEIDNLAPAIFSCWNELCTNGLIRLCSWSYRLYTSLSCSIMLKIIAKTRVQKVLKVVTGFRIRKIVA